MKYQLASLLMTILLAGTYALSCNYCMEGTNTINGNKSDIPDQIKCENPQKMNCSENQVCIIGNMTASLSNLDGETELMQVQMRNCSEIRDGKASCNIDKIIDANTKAGFIIINSYACNIDVQCSTDYCSSGCSPEITLTMGLLLAFLVGQ